MENATGLGQSLAQFALIGILLKLVVKALFNWNWLKEIVRPDGTYFSGTDFRKGFITILSITFCILYDYRFIEQAFNLTAAYPIMGKWMDIFCTGILLSGGTQTVHDFLEEQKKLRKIAIKAKEDKINGE